MEGLMMDDLAEFMKAGAEESQRATAHLPKPIAFVWVSLEGNAMDVCLDTSQSTFSEWIAGEWGDISLHREQETRRLAGAYLPLYAKTLVIAGSNFPAITINLETGAVEVDGTR